MTARLPMRCGLSSTSLPAGAGRFRLSWNGIARFPIGPCSRPRPWRHKRSWIVTRRDSYSDRPMLPADISSRDPGEKPSYGAAFSGALIDPERAIPNCVAGPNGKTATKRYNVYRNNVTVSLMEALASIYPEVQRITGAEFFRAMARFHVRAAPPTSPLLFEYGRDFPAFIESYEYAHAMPWLADTARIERAWLDAYHAADALPLSRNALAEVPAARLSEVAFVAHPAARIVRSDYPAVAIFAMNRTDGSVTALKSSSAED